MDIAKEKLNFERFYGARHGYGLLETYPNGNYAYQHPQALWSAWLACAERKEANLETNQEAFELWFKDGNGFGSLERTSLQGFYYSYAIVEAQFQSWLHCSQLETNLQGCVYDD